MKKLAPKPFRLERQMLAPVRRWCEAHQLVTKTEYQSPWGICDLVALEFDALHVRNRMDLGQRECIGTPIRIQILQAIPDGDDGSVVDLKRVEQRFADCLSPTEFDAEVRTLAARRFLTFPRPGHVQRVNGWMPLQRRIVAIEMKLSRYEDAVAQAAANLRFADESFVALPLEAAQRVLAAPRRAESASRRRVGILGVSTTSCTVLVESSGRNESLSAVAQAHCAERFFRDYVRGN